MKNFKKTYAAKIAKLKKLFPSDSREQLEQMFIVLMRDDMKNAREEIFD